nr:MAG TPA: NinG protein [Caudoviricetes sp.]DAQ97851.1 MAG TPA: NinG protein [Caudoviricetes sp.]
MDNHMTDETEEEQYRSNKSAMVGQPIICAGPYCHKEFKKRYYQQAFCCLKCKDQYWNKKRER